MRRLSYVLWCLVGVGCASRAKVRDSLIVAGDRRLAAGEGEIALANYDQAIASDPDHGAALIEKRKAAAIKVAEQARELARQELADGKPVESFVRLWNLDKGGAYGAEVDRAFFEEDYERTAKAVWEQVDAGVQSGRHFLPLQAATQVAAAFPEGHWSHTRLAELKQKLVTYYKDRADRSAEGTTGRAFAQAVAGVLGGDLSASKILRDNLEVTWGIQSDVQISASGDCESLATKLRNQIPNISGARRKVTMTGSLTCSINKQAKSGTRTEYYTEKVPVEVEKEHIVREEYGTLGAQRSVCQADTKGNCTWATVYDKGQTTYWLRKVKSKEIEYREEKRSREVPFDYETQTLYASGSVVAEILVQDATTGAWTGVGTRNRDIKGSAESWQFGAREEDSIAGQLYSGTGIASVLSELSDAMRISFTKLATDAAAAGDPWRASMGYVLATYTGSMTDGAKAYLDKTLGITPAQLGALIKGEEMFGPLPTVALELPHGDVTQEQDDYAQAQWDKEWRATGLAKSGVDAGFRIRRSPLAEPGMTDSVGFMNSIELGGRWNNQSVRISIGAKGLGGSTGGFNFEYTGKTTRDNGSSIFYGVSAGGEIRHGENQHTSFAGVLGYIQPIGPASLLLQADANLIQIFKGTGTQGDVMHLSPLLGFVELPLGPLFLRGGGSYFIGGPSPLSFEAMAGARVVLGRE